MDADARQNFDANSQFCELSSNRDEHRWPLIHQAGARNGWNFRGGVRWTNPFPGTESAEAYAIRGNGNSRAGCPCPYFGGTEAQRERARKI